MSIFATTKKPQNYVYTQDIHIENWKPFDCGARQNATNYFWNYDDLMRCIKKEDNASQHIYTLCVSFVESKQFEMCVIWVLHWNEKRSSSTQQVFQWDWFALFSTPFPPRDYFDPISQYCCWHAQCKMWFVCFIKFATTAIASSSTISFGNLWGSYVKRQT